MGVVIWFMLKWIHSVHCLHGINYKYMLEFSWKEKIKLKLWLVWLILFLTSWPTLSLMVQPINSLEWWRQNFSLQYKYNIKQTSNDKLRIYESHIWLSYILNRLFITSRVYLEPPSWPALTWLVGSVGRALHRYRRGHGFKSRTGFSGLIFTTA